MDTDPTQVVKRELVAWLDAQRAHVAEQVRAMPAVMAGEQVDLPEGYEGWTAPEPLSDEELLEHYCST